MKKILCIACVCLMLISLMAPLSMLTSAATSTFDIAIGNAETDPGKVAKVPITCTKNTSGIWGFQFEISFDKEYLNIPKADVAERDSDGRIVESVYTDFTDSNFTNNGFSILANAEETETSWTIIINAMSSSLTENNMATGKIMDVYIELSDTATRGEDTSPIQYNITGALSQNNMIDYEGNEVSSAITNGYVTSTGYTFEISGANAEIKKDGVTDTEYNGAFEDPKSERTYYIVEGVWTKKTGLTLCDGSLYYFINGILDLTKNGLFEYTDGKLYNLKDGMLNPETTLVKDADGNWCYVQNGVWTITNTIVKYNNKWFYVKNGYYNPANKDTTIVNYNGKWYYIKSGVYAPSDTTLCKYNGKWYYIQKGVWTKSNTIVKYNDKWFYVKAGIYNSANKDTTIVQHTNGKWYYIQSGVYTPSATTLCKYNGKWFYIQKGVWTKSNTIVKYNGKWFYVKAGIYNSANKDTTIVQHTNGKWYYIKSGVYTPSATTLCKYNNKWYYIQKGVWTKTNTIVKYNGKWLFVKAGIYNSANKDTTIVKYTDGKWYYIKNGVKNNSTCIMTYNKVKRYIKAGVWQNGFSGKVKIGTKTYTVKKGNIV